MLLTNKNVLKLSDLEMSSLIETSQVTSDTQIYMSPEQFRCQNGQYSTKTDIW
jgi:serine/threonine protein kinase